MPFSTAGAEHTGVNRFANGTNRMNGTPSLTASSSWRDDDRREPGLDLAPGEAVVDVLESGGAGGQLFKQPGLDDAALERGKVRDFVMKHHHGVARDEAGGKA